MAQLWIKRDRARVRRATAVVAAVWSLTAIGIAVGQGAALSARQYALAEMPIVSRIKVPVGPGWLATGFGSVWVSKSESRRVLRIDPVTNKVIATIAVGPDAELAIGIGMGSVWVADIKDRTIRQIDPQTNRVVRTIPVMIAVDPEGSFGVGDDSLWVLTDDGGTDSGTLTRIDATSGKVVAQIPVSPKSHAAILAFNSVWVTSSAAGTVTRVDASSNAIVATIGVRALPRFLVASDDGVWSLSQSDGSLARIDPSTNRVVATIEVGVPGDGGDLSVGEKYIWISGERMPLSQVDPATNQLVRQYVGGTKDDTLRVAFGAAWIVSERQGQIWKVELEKLAAMPLRP